MKYVVPIIAAALVADAYYVFGVLIPIVEIINVIPHF